MARKQIPANFSDLIKRYVNGESLENIAQELHCGQSWLRFQFMKHGIHLRSRGEATKLRMEKLGVVGRLQITAAAHFAASRRKQPRSEIVLRMRNRALALQERNSPLKGGFEYTVFKCLKRAGFPARSQRAIHGYNVDLAVPPVAVEVHVAVNNPMANPILRKRTEKLLELNWNVAYVWITRGKWFSREAADKLISIVQAVRSDPSAPCQYWVIRGTGEVCMTGLHVDYVPRISSSI